MADLYPTVFNKEYRQQIQANLPTQENMPPSVSRHNIQNPFNSGDFSNFGGLPDTPIQMGGGISEALLGNHNVPESIRKEFWWAFSNDVVLSFADEEKKRDLLLNFDVTKIDVLNSIPYFDYTFAAEMQWNVLRNVFETKVNRSVGFKSNAKNERILLQSQFTEQRQISEQSMSGAKEGFFKRLLGRRG